MRTQSADTIVWTITDILDEAPNVKTLVLKTPDGTPDFIAGQYLTVRLPHFEPREGKSYSIASTPGDSHVLLTVKAIGAFSRALVAHKVGDKLETSAPYGFFYPEQDEVRDLAFIAGGIGITPCLSIIRSRLMQSYENRITLFYSNRTIPDIVFREKIDMLTASHESFNAHHFITRESNGELPYRYERMNAEHIRDALPAIHETDFFICGSIEFTKGMWKDLCNAGIDQRQLYTEGFF